MVIIISGFCYCTFSPKLIDHRDKGGGGGGGELTENPAAKCIRCMFKMNYL